MVVADRRTIIKMLTAAALTGCSASDKSGKPLKVVVAGAGIIGASVAYHLARAGAAVTVVDKVGPASHASGGTFAWINATWAKQPRAYHSLSQDSVSNWHTLQDELQIPVRWGGSLEWYGTPERQALLAEQIAEQLAWGERSRMISADELATLEPNVDLAGASTVAFSENDGAVDAVVATQTLLRAAEELGATLRYPEELIDIELANGRLKSVTTTHGKQAADRLILATGADEVACQKFAAIDIPQRTRCGSRAAPTATLPIRLRPNTPRAPWRPPTRLFLV